MAWLLILRWVCRHLLIAWVPPPLLAGGPSQPANAASLQKENPTKTNCVSDFYRQLHKIPLEPLQTPSPAATPFLIATVTSAQSCDPLLTVPTGD